jgi:hypothetical protein
MRGTVASIWLALVVAGCGAVPGQTSDARQEQPGPGSAVIQGDPPITDAVTVIEFIGAEGNVINAQTTRIEPGNNIRASVWRLPGVIRVAVNGVVCEGDVTLEADLRMAVTVRHDFAGCSLVTVRSEPLSS